MRSIYARISLWSFGTLVLSLIAFLGVTMVVSFRDAHRTGSFGRIQSLELEETMEAYESGGPRKVNVFIERLHKYVPGKHFFTDASGRDLLTGEDRSALLAAAVPEGSLPKRFRGPIVVMANPRTAGTAGSRRWTRCRSIYLAICRITS